MPSTAENFPRKNDRTFHQRCLSRARDEPAETPLAPARGKATIHTEPHDDVIKWKHFSTLPAICAGITAETPLAPARGKATIHTEPHDDVIKWKHFATLPAICAGNSPVPGEFPAQRPVTRSFDVLFDLHPNRRLSKHWWGW